MIEALISTSIAFTITFLCIPVIILIAEEKKLFDIPDDRKTHSIHVSCLGGLGIFAGFVMACLLTKSNTNVPELQYYIAATLLIFIIGLKDDILLISPAKKFMGQTLAACIIIFKGGMQLNSLYGFLGLDVIPAPFSQILTYFTIIVVVNAFNLIDGVDGLAGSLGLMSAGVVGFYFIKIGMTPYAILAFSLAGSLAAFLIFNFQPAKIFMGDAGSLLTGLVIAILVIKFINVSYHNNIFPVQAPPAIGFSILMVPLLDTLRVFIIRVLRRRSPFSADRNHIHHVLLDLGLSHRTVTLSLVSVNMLFIILVYVSRTLGNTWLIIAMIALFFVAISILRYMRKKQLLLFSEAPVSEHVQNEVYNEEYNRYKDIRFINDMSSRK